MPSTSGGHCSCPLPPIDHFVLAFDDILIYSSAFEEHVHKALAALQRHQLNATHDERVCVSIKVEFLDHVVNPDGLRVQ